MKTKIIPIG